MGKLPTIPPGDTTRDDARAAGRERTGRTSARTAAAVVARFSAVADSAAAGRARRFPIGASARRGGSASREECARESTATGAEARAAIGGARGRRDDAGVVAVVVGAIARPRRHTWHAAGESEAVEEAVVDRHRRSANVTGGDNGDGSRFDASDAPRDERRDAGIAPGDERTCCVATADVGPFRARRRARDRAARRNRRAGGVLPVRSRSIDVAHVAEKMLHSTVDSITTGRREIRDRFPVPFAEAADVSKCDGRDCPSDNANEIGAAGGSSITVLEIRESIGSVKTEHTRAIPGDPDTDGVPSSRHRGSFRLIELADEERPCVKEADSSATSSQFPAKIDPGGRSRARTGACWKSPRIGPVLRALLLGMLAMSLFCDTVLAAPSPADVMDIYEGGIEDEELAMPGNRLSDNELEIIRKSIVQGLGLQRIPDASKANVSQAEYERAHREYLKQVQLSHGEPESRTRRDLHVFQTADHPWNRSILDVSRGNYRHSLYFPVAVPDDAADLTIDHASLRFLLQGDHGRSRDLEVLVYLRTPVSRRLLLRRSVPQEASADSRWLELDSTEAVAGWLEQDLENRGLELEFRHDGRPARREIFHATLNVFTVSEPGGNRRRRSTPEELMPLHKGRRSKCKGDNNKKCCRHELSVMFKDLKGFEFIVYPKSFDAGYCKGRCPPRYNPAHHHALLQSLLWKEDRKRVPKPCCAPSKLDQLAIVYFDEEDVGELKVSYWKNIQVLECACS